MAPAMRRRRSPVLPACQFRAVSRILKQLIAENQQLGQSVLAVRNRTRDAACRPLALSPPHVVAASAASAAPSHGGSRGGDGLAAGRPAMPGLGRTFRRQPAQVAASSWKGPETGTEKAPPPGPLSRCGMLRPPGMPNTVRPADAGIRSGTAMSTAISHTGNTGRRGASDPAFAGMTGQRHLLVSAVALARTFRRKLLKTLETRSEMALPPEPRSSSSPGRHTPAIRRPGVSVARKFRCKLLKRLETGSEMARGRRQVASGRSDGRGPAHFGARLARMRWSVRRCMLSWRAVSDTLRSQAS